MSLPILLVTDPNHRGNPFGAYLGEILKTEGFGDLHRVEVGALEQRLLRDVAVVVLAEGSLGGTEREMLREYVAAGGRLIAMRPDPGLAELFGLRYVGTMLEETQQYLGIDPGSEIGRGIEAVSLQYHGLADRYEMVSGTVAAWLYESESVRSSYPAVVEHRYGKGRAVAFCYDLARSVALMRQGNPDWACGPNGCEDGDGFEGIRPVDAFLRQTGERWVNPARIPIPQADEQQRLLANCLMALTEDVLPLPRLWYLPSGKRAVLVMTGDGDDVGFSAFDPVIRAVEEYGGHFCAYLHPLEGDPTRGQVDEWIARGHEVSLHVDDTAEASRPTLEGMRSAYTRGVERFRSLYGRDPGPSVRHHWLIWYGWVDAAEVALAHGTRLDFDYYHGRQWRLPDGRWVNGYLTGSGLPQKFVREDGAVLDIYQLLTEWSDETQLWRQELGIDGATELVREMFDAAEQRYPTMFVANFHPGGWQKRRTEPWARNMMREAVERGVPIWSGQELYGFLAARDSASIAGVSWDGVHLRFTLESGKPVGLLTVMLPVYFGRQRLKGVIRDGTGVESAIQRVAGHDYALVGTTTGCHEFVASYGL